eukprot:CAMPEP_0185725878 /NCGR_PEP_ID=MMETSP1171-20130828/2011_1 /TAXON_ID=374046 /ORGANISM="Helicotheca tamensis, Strain CCMP826" /LENGTH=156 /DNA_ID=CAMNT_0028394101 /DNA_START=128 /DNA_END=598 /DNA_ORIENTATION=+
MKIEYIFSILSLAASIFMVHSIDLDFDDKRELLGNSVNCTMTCELGNPCEPGTDQFFYRHCKRRFYMQCDANGGCFEKKCPKGTRWNQDFLSCVHKTCGECNNNCRGKDVAEGKFHKRHCTSDTKFRQCDNFGGCFEMDCPAGTIFKNKKRGCVHM